MIKTVIKRDGSREPFDAAKINGWGEWASKTLGKSVNWTEIVLESLSPMPETVSSVDIQNALIDNCIHKNTWAYNRMAGRLYIAMLYKDIDSDLLKSVVKPIKTIHQELVDAGIMSEDFMNAFSYEDYARINEMIAHKRDLTYSHFQIKQIIKKYSLQNRVTNKLYETPQYVYMRVAMRLCMNFKKDRLKHIEKFYYYFSTNKINIPTPYFTNAGTGKNGFNSCCVYKADDNLRSLAIGDHIAYTMTYSSAGIGSYIQTRVQGSPIRSGLVEHKGKAPYYKSLAAAVKANTQNGRGGACTVTYDALDADVMTIQQFKNPLTPQSKQIREIDYSMAFNRLVVEKAAKGEEIALFSIHNAPEVVNNYTNPDIEEFKRLYEIAVSENRHEAMVPAREIIIGCLTQSIETGRHYYCNLTELNRHTPFKESIWQSNLCLVGDTEVIVLDGDNEVKMSLKGVIESDANLKVKSYNHESDIVEYKTITDKALMNKNVKVMKITDSESGKFIKCTPEHRVYTKNRGYVMAKDLCETDELVIEQ